MFSRIVRSLVRQFYSSFPEEDYIPLAPLILYLALLFLFFLYRLYA